jgi:DNA-binding SARP family transcriptional activator
MSGFRVSLFGRFRVECGQGPVEGLDAQKAQELFAFLLIHRDRPHFREKLATLLWENSAPSQAKGYLRQALWQLQSALGAAMGCSEIDLVSADADWIQVNVGPDLWLDVGEFERAFARTKGVPARELDGEQVAVLQAAVCLYQSDLLENWYQDWCLFERERLQNIYLAMLDKLLGHCETCYDYEAGIEYAARLLNCDLAHERTYRRLMRLHYLTGDRTGALRTYQRCVAALQEELGVAPAKNTQHLYHQIQRGAALSRNGHQAGGPAPTREMDPVFVLRILHELDSLQDSLFDVQRRIEQDIESLRSTFDNNG